MTVNTQRLSAGIAVLFLMVSLAGCSDGGGNGDLRTPDSPSGSFLHGEVAGLQYESYTWRGGITDPDGQYFYVPGEEIAFSVGDIDLGSASAKGNITPVDLAPERVNGIDPVAINMTRFLLSIDDDGNSANGIVITGEAREALEGQALDFASEDFDSEAEAIVESLDADEIISEDNGPRTLASAADAESFLLDAVADIEAEEAAAAEDAALFEAWIQNPYPGNNLVIVRGQSFSPQGFVKGGSAHYAYEWALNGTVFSTALNPGASFSSLVPGTYSLTFTVLDTGDGVRIFDRRLLTVLDPAQYGTLPAQDELMQTGLSHTDSTTVAPGGTFRVRAVILHGNPPFQYAWSYPASVGFSYGEDPLEAVFTFPSAGRFSIWVYFMDTPFAGLGPDTWYETRLITVSP